jgi:tetratricopeptide (TPR) repeat protein
VSAETDRSALYRLGVNALREGNVAQSAQYWHDLAAQDSKDWVALQNLAFCKLQLECYEEVEELAHRALKMSPANESGELYRLLSEAAYHLMDFTAAVQYAEEALARRPDDTKMLQVLAYSSIFAGDIKKLKATVARAKLSHRDDAVFQFISAKLALHEQPARAWGIISALLSAYPEEPEILELAGEICIANNEMDQGERYLSKASQLPAANAKNVNALGWFYFREKRYVEALDAFNRSTNRYQQQFEGYLGKGYCHLALGQVQEAARLAAETIGLAPHDERTWELNFQVAFRKKDRVAAKQALLKIRKIDPDGRTEAGKMAREYFRENH